MIKFKRFLSTLLAVLMVVSLVPLSTITASAAATISLNRPLDTAYKITAREYYSDKSYHGAIDYGCPKGTPVYAAESGTVTVHDGGYGDGYYGCEDGNGWGNYIDISHSNGYSTRYAHMSTGSFVVTTGTSVQRGQLIGYSGNSGNSTGAHLHFGLYLNGKKVYPEPYIKTATGYFSDVTLDVDTRYPTPFTARILSTSNVPCYSSVNGYSGNQEVYPGDDCIIQAVYTNGWCKFKCPWPDKDNMETKYAPLSIFIKDTDYTPVKVNVPRKTTTYIRSDASKTYGNITAGDDVTVVSTSGEYVQVIYPISSKEYECGWAKVTYNVKYNANGGTGAPKTETKICTKNLTLSSTKPTRNGYTFLGWAANDKNATKADYQPGGKYKKNEDVTLYAVWEKNCTKHTYSYKVKTTPTVSAKGALQGTCTNCGETTSVTLPKLNTTDYTYKVTTPAQCEKNGTAEYTWNTKTYGTYSFTVPLEKTGHKLGDWTVVKEAADFVEGEKRRNCTACDYYETEVIPATKILYFGDCNLDGVADFHDMTMMNRYILGKSEPDYSLEEFYLRVDLNRDGTVKQEDMELVNQIRLLKLSQSELMEEHTHAQVPSSAKQFYQLGEPLDTADFSLEILFQNGHKYSISEGITISGYDPNQSGIQTITVSFYQFSATYTVEVHAHSYYKTVTAPTCTEGGYTTYTCDCGDSYTGDEKPATGHTYGDWTVTISPTCTESGTEEHKCQNCVYSETREVPATGHSYMDVVKEPTIGEQGYTTHICLTCADNYVDSYTDALTAVAQIGNTQYGTVSDALADAKSGDTVTLLADSDESNAVLTIYPGVTLDLGANTLTANYVIGLNGSSINAARHTAEGAGGKLKVLEDNISLSTAAAPGTNETLKVLPIWMGDGYMFMDARIDMETVKAEKGTMTLEFYPNTTSYVRKNYFKNNGSSAYGLSVIIRVEWTETQDAGDVKVNKEYFYTDDLIRNTYGNNALEKDYNLAVDMENCEALKDLVFTVAMVTDAGVEITSQPYAYEDLIAQ